MACLQAGHTGEALDIADEIIALAGEHDNPMLHAMGLLLRGMAMHAWEHFDDAVHVLDEAAALAVQQDVGAHGVYRDALLARAALEMDLGRVAEARKLVERVEEATMPVEPPHELHRLRALRIRGQIAVAERAPDEALVQLSSALGIAEELQDVLETGLTAHYLAFALTQLGRHPEASERSAQAKRLLRERGARHELRRLGYSEQPRPRIASTRAVTRPASDPVDLEPESAVVFDPSSHLGDTQSGLDSHERPLPDAGEAAADSALHASPAARADGEK